MARRKKAVLEPSNGGTKKAAPRDYRCNVCGRLMFRGILQPGTVIQIACWHGNCKTRQEVRADLIGVVVG